VGTSAGTSIMTVWSSGMVTCTRWACMFVSQRFCQGCYLCASTMVCGDTSSRFRQEEVHFSLLGCRVGGRCGWGWCVPS
jgi:hypothetical protein